MPIVTELICKKMINLNKMYSTKNKDRLGARYMKLNLSKSLHQLLRVKKVRNQHRVACWGAVDQPIR